MEERSCAVFEPGGRPVNAGLVPDEQKSEAEESEAGFSSGMHCDFMTELCKGNFEFIQNKTSTSGPVFEGINDVVPDIKGTTADNDETGSDHGESSSYSSDVPLIDPSLDPDLPADGKNDETTDYRQYGILEKAYDKRLSDTFDETVIGAYVNRSSETFPANSHCLSSENIHGYECNTGFMTPKMPKKMDIVTTVGKDDKIDTQPAYLDYIDYVEVQEISVVTPVHVIGPCWEFGSMSSVHLPNRECSNFRSRTNTIDQQSYMGSHRDVHGGSNRLLARVFSNTIGSMEFGKKDNKELSLTFLPNTESQIAEYTKQSFCNSNSKNLLIVSIGVTLMFIAMFGLTNLQSSMNSEGGLGVYSLAMSFVPFMLGSLFSPVIIKRFRPKACLIFGCLSPLFYVIVNFRPTFAFFLPASFILGLSKVVLWNAVSTYITEIGIDESNRKNKPPDNVISRYYGIFFLTLQLAFVFGNLISSLILLPSSTNDLDIAMLLNSSNVTKDIDVEYIETVNGTEVDFFGSYTNTTSLCGSGFCNSDEADGSQATVGDLNKTILLGLYSCCIVLSTVILVLFLDHLPEYSATYTSFRDAVYQAKSVLMMLFDGQFLLLLLMCMYTIISNGFIVADIIKAYVTCPLGIHMVGYTMICFGFTGAASSYIGGKLVKHTGRIAIYSVAAAINVGSLIWMITWQPTADDTYAIFVLLGLWGIAEGIWQSQINSLITSVFADRYEEAFGCCRFVQGLAGIIVFSMSENLCMMTKILITMATCIISVFLYFVLEVKRKMCNRQQINRELEIAVN